MSYSLPALIILCVTLYSSLFFLQEDQISRPTAHLSPALPAKLLRASGNIYLKQLIAEVLYIKTAVYYGGLKKEADLENLSIMADHFKIMSQLHPQMIDIYYRSESALAHRGDNYVKATNKILETGRIAIPNEVALPFFEGFNYLNYLDKPMQAAMILKDASQIHNAPQWIGHLASVLMAGEGNIRSGLALLQGMYASSQDKHEKKRYMNDIKAFKKALQVQQALIFYRQQHKKSVASLKELIPHYLKQLPVWEHGYYLQYHAPTLSLLRRSQ